MKNPASQGFGHISVMPEEAVEALKIRPEGQYLDGTLGGAGHAAEIARRLGPEGRLYGFDLDADAIAEATERLKDEGDKVRLFRDNFKNAVSVLKEAGVPALDGILLDLGVSSHQIDDPARGFSYMQDAPLDMRMAQDRGKTAADLLQEETEEELTRIFRDYGEERFAKAIAHRIVTQREEAPVATTEELNEIIYATVPKTARKKGSHPSKRVFQALRIAVNEELTGLDESLDEMIGFLAPGGRIAVITFHSLEDRIVKQCFRRNENPCICPPQFPVCTCGRTPAGKQVTRKAIVPSEEEIGNNTRAKSAKLRVFERAGRN
ncbi:MAG: 16S rRNA (cytosine(1402)-N(4))-methyltransferase RsmH [Lachnospiraceae bacterium]|nr:16S rRNA (cytosine(1402)-N(4))-methyltransferase RsmH [Lachnospiraceae bacterium]